MKESGGKEVHPELLERIAAYMESVNLGAYVDLYRRPWRMLGLNFIAGIARGFGMAIGFAVLGAVVIYTLRSSFLHNLPVVGKIIAQIVQIVQHEMSGRIGR
ncbi:MAG: DUF5665 domain-containing protein [Thermaerobacter sp.]|nr:DUF5665 domain-containing protein [Thermaerobacter sp.]